MPVAKKKPKLPMKEILIAAGVLLSILIIALVVGHFKKGAVDVELDRIRKQTEILDRNIKSATDELKRAVDLGLLFCVGQDKDVSKAPARLFAPFKGNPKIYNVIYNRDYKDKTPNQKSEQFALVDDTEHRTIKGLNKAIPEDKDLKDVSIKYGLATDKDKLLPVVVAQKIIHSKDSTVDLGGSIMVIVVAEEDDFLHKAIQKVTDAEKGDTKPADAKAASDTKPGTSDKGAPKTK